MERTSSAGTCTSNYQCSLCGWFTTDLSELLVHPCAVSTGIFLFYKLSVCFGCFRAHVNICIHLGTEESTSTLVPANVKSQPTFRRWEDRHVRLLIERYLKFKGLIEQRNNTEKGVFDKLADDFNKHADVKSNKRAVLKKVEKLETKQKEIEDSNRQTGRAHKTVTRKWSSA